MCGIAGFAGLGDANTLQNMAATLKHRGPDDSGIWLEQNVGLAHTRLAIIDVTSEGHQPMLSVDGRYVIIFNGEIYNFRELRKELSAYTFKTQSDTEVILAAYAAWGVSAFERLDGMFALALYDTKEQELILARDRLGKKPLFWTFQNQTLVFGSELKALWQHPHAAKQIDPRSLSHYLAREYVPTPRTMFRDVHKLMPSSLLRMRNGEISQAQFWKPCEEVLKVYSEQEAVRQFDALLDSATTKRLISDVPLGIFLSGGIDSSTVAYYAAQHGSIDTFSIGFEEKSFDESKEAELVAKHLGTNHHAEVLSADAALAMVTEIPNVFDEPVADASVLPTLLLSRFARKKVTVALGGDGADELLFGYPTFRAEQYASMYEKLPAAVRGAAASLTDALPSSSRYFSFDFKAKKFTQDFSPDMRTRHLQWLGSFNETEIDELLTPVYRSSQTSVTQELISQWAGECAFEEPLNQLSHLYLRTYCMDDVLVKVDRASMRYALEVRTPFLDPAVVTFLLSLPPELKYKKRKSKYLLRKLMQGRLPDSILNRHKQGFAAPIAQWLRGPLREMCTDLLSPSRIVAQGIFESQIIDRLVREHMSGSYDHRKKLWTLLVFQLWWERWMR